MQLRILRTAEELASAAAEHAAESLAKLLETRERARVLAATGASQMRFLERLTEKYYLDWNRVEIFHLDEYAGLGMDHPASFARYIKQRFVDRTGIRRYHLLDGTWKLKEMAAEMGREIRKARIDLAFVGIGENGHLAFNDPPADFETDEAYIVVELDRTCREQQVGEGWFARLEDVPERAISISIPELLKSREILCVVPDERKARAVKACLEGPISPEAPASALRAHPNTTIFLDAGSASLLTRGAGDPVS